MDYQVTCIVPHNTISGRIQAIGGPAFGVISEDQAMGWMAAGATFYTLVNGVRANVRIGGLWPHSYLTTSPDGYLPNNLLHLSYCPSGL